MTDTDSGRPTPPEGLDDDLSELLEALAERDRESVSAVATYVTELEAWLESAAESTPAAESGAVEREADAATDEPSSDPACGDADGAATLPAEPPQRPADVPERATVSVMTVAGTNYCYYQWRDGDEIRSKTVELE